MKKYTLVSQISFLFCIFFSSAFSGISAWAIDAESHPGLNSEAIFEEASLAYNRQQFDEALGILNSLIAQQPKFAPALELKALISKAKGDDDQAIEMYARLLHLKPRAECGPYFFEAAVILNKRGGTEKAKSYFDAAIELGFNTSAAHLFLGMIQFNGGDPKSAELHFQEVVKTGLSEMQVVAHYYLGLIYLKEGYAPTGAQELQAAKDTAATTPGNKTAEDTASAADKIMDSFKRGQWFGSFGLMAQYDSNISEVPSSSGIQAQASNAGTPQLSISAGYGYMSPADARIQYIPSYQFGYNQNFNSNTKQYEYASNAFSLYINRYPLNPLSYGFKAQGIFIFQNLPNDATDSSSGYTLSKFSLEGVLGPYVKYQISPQLRFEGELDFSPQKYYTTPDQTGNMYTLKGTLKEETHSTYFNPGGTLSYSIDSTQGAELSNNALGLSLFNVSRPTISDTVTVNIDYSINNYSQTSPQRKDNTFTPHVSALHSINNHWSLVGDLSYTINTSTVPDSYSYHRVVIGAGATYAL